MSGRERVSVVICAYTQKRWDRLNAAIASVLAQPAAPQIVLVIDHEDELLERVRRRWPELTALSNEFQRGLSGARNTGVRHASGDLVAFLDDDAVAEAEWLHYLLAPFADAQVVCVGGSARPDWPDGRPSPFPDELLWTVGCTYLGQPTERADVRNVMGCSMAFRRGILVAAGAFDLNTGRVGSIPLGCEETELCIRLRQLDPDRRIVFEPRSVVTHAVSADRTTWGYLCRRCFFEGISKSALARTLGRSDSLASERRYLRRVLPSGVWRELRRGRLNRAAAILVSVAAAASGYLFGAARAVAITRPPSGSPSDSGLVGEPSR